MSINGMVHISGEDGRCRAHTWTSESGPYLPEREMLHLVLDDLALTMSRVLAERVRDALTEALAEQPRVAAVG